MKEAGDQISYYIYLYTISTLYNHNVRIYSHNVPRSVSWNWRLSRELAITLQNCISVLKHIITIIITDCSDSLGRLLHARHDGPGGDCVRVVQQARVRETANIGLNRTFGNKII